MNQIFNLYRPLCHEFISHLQRPIPVSVAVFLQTAANI